MSLQRLFSHSQDQHVENTSEIVHFLTSPMVSIFIYLLVLFFGYYLLTALKVGKDKMMMAFLMLNLACGLLLINLVPLLSGIAITVGIFTAFMTFLGSELK